MPAVKLDNMENESSVFLRMFRCLEKIAEGTKMNSVIKSLNLTEGAVLTLERLNDRIEFETVVVVSGQRYIEDPCLIHGDCTVCLDTECHPRYINCHPYK